MKKFIPFLVLISAQTALASGDAQQFVGRYRPDPEMCDSRSFKEAERIYVKHEDSYWGRKEKPTKVLMFHAYGDDATSEEVMLGSGVRQAPGTSRDVHGEVPHRWETRISDNVLKSYESVSRPSLGYSRREVTTLTAFKYGLRYERTTQVRGEPKKSERCKLVAY